MPTNAPVGSSLNPDVVDHGQHVKAPLTVLGSPTCSRSSPMATPKPQKIYAARSGRPQERRRRPDPPLTPPRFSDAVTGHPRHAMTPSQQHPNPRNTVTPQQHPTTEPATTKTSTMAKTIQAVVALLLLAASIPFLVALRRIESTLDRANARPAPAASTLAK